MRKLLAGALALWTSVALAVQSIPPTAPYIPPTGFQDVGSPTPCPFVLVVAGQSNAQGMDHVVATPKSVSAGIRIVNWNGASDVGSVTPAIITAAYGVHPLDTNSLGGGFTTSPVSAAANMGVAFANTLRAQPWFPANRDIVIVPNWLGGQSIGQWVASGASSAYWPGLVQGLSTVQSYYAAQCPQIQINHLIWSQGEQDSDNLGTYGSSSLYGAAFATLLAQWRALSAWQTDTTISVQELAGWYANYAGNARNDFIHTLRGGAYDPFIMLVPYTGVPAGTDQPGPHFSGDGLNLLGVRHFAAWLEGRINGGYGNAAGADVFGSAGVFGNAFSVTTGGTLNIGPGDLRSGSAALLASGGTVNLPASNQLTTAVIFASVSVTTTFNALSVSGATNTILFPTIQAGQSSGTLPSGRYLIFNLGNNWVVQSVAQIIGQFQLNSKGYSAGSSNTLNVNAMMGWVHALSSGSAALPSPSNGSWAFFYNIPGASGPATLTGSIVTPDGVTNANYSLVPNAAVLLVGTNNTWVVQFDTAGSLGESQYSAPLTGTTVSSKSGVGNLTHIIDPAGTIVALTIALPTNPRDGSKVTYIATQIISAATFSGGTIVGAPTAFTAGQHTTFVYSSAQSKWY